MIQTENLTKKMFYPIVFIRSIMGSDPARSLRKCMLFLLCEIPPRG